jgi:hypothetical protein
VITRNIIASKEVILALDFEGKKMGLTVNEDKNKS